MKHLTFGDVFSDYMLVMDYKNGQWQAPQIVPYGEINIMPAMCSLHYGQVIFEGVKAFYSKQGKINIFRLPKYHERMNKSCRRLCIPEISYDVFLNSIMELIKLERAWVPHQRGYSLYIRPFIFATDNHLGVRVSSTYRFMIILSPVESYYKEGLNPIRLITSGEYVRAAKGGLGAAKTPGTFPERRTLPASLRIGRCLLWISRAPTGRFRRGSLRLYSRRLRRASSFPTSFATPTRSSPATSRRSSRSRP